MVFLLLLDVVDVMPKMKPKFKKTEQVDSCFMLWLFYFTNIAAVTVPESQSFSSQVSDQLQLIHKSQICDDNKQTRLMCCRKQRLDFLHHVDQMS